MIRPLLNLTLTCGCGKGGGLWVEGDGSGLLHKLLTQVSPSATKNSKISTLIYMVTTNNNKYPM